MKELKIYHQCLDINNFGDIVGTWIIEKRYGVKCVWENSKDEPVLFTGGTQLVNSHLNAIICGCGFNNAEETCEPPYSIEFIRGKLTRKRLLEIGIECPETYHDYTYDLPEYFDADKLKTGQYNIGFIPHYIDKPYFNAVQQNGFHLIDVCAGVESVVAEALKCQHIISSSLHGLILAHCFNIPFTWVSTINPIVSPEFKFHDWASAFDITLERKSMIDIFDFRLKDLQNFEVEKIDIKNL